MGVAGVTEPVEEAPKNATLQGQRRGGRRRHRTLAGDRLVIVGPHDRIHHTGDVVGLGTVDVRHEA
ncbi:MAG: hypothetical protein QOC60_1198, partial [Frankiaceae bacterium]|nr:hypothetical protein [Frankiaceae bacterium]